MEGQHEATEKAVVAFDATADKRPTKLWKAKLLMCHLNEARKTTSCCPAVHVNLGQGKWAVFPLAKPEFSSVWTNNEQLGPWTLKDFHGTWLEAEREFAVIVGYHRRFVKAVLKVLQEGRFLDGSSVNIATWSKDSRYDVEKIHALFQCHRCKEFHKVSPRLLHMLPSDEAKFACEDAEFECSVMPNIKPPPTILAEDDSIGSTTSIRKVEKSVSKLGLTTPSMHKQKTATFGSFHELMRASETGNRNVHHKWVDSDMHLQSPSQFVAGTPVVTLCAPEPTEIELSEYEAIFSSEAWTKLLLALTKWRQNNSDCDFEGTESVSKLMAWNESIRTFFEGWRVTNVVVQGMLATMTLIKDARNWWRAHLTQRPNMVISFPQLLELIKRELVPTSLPTASHRAWRELFFTGNVEAYLKRVGELMIQHPVEPRSAHVLAALPVSTAFTDTVEAIDERLGGEGMTFPAFKRQLRVFVKEKGLATERRNAWNEKRKTVTGRRVGANESMMTDLSEDARVASATKSSEGLPRFCLVCGDPRHLWPSCFKRTRSGCAKCGSTAHFVRDCAQKWQTPREIKAQQIDLATVENIEPTYPKSASLPARCNILVAEREDSIEPRKVYDLQGETEPQQEEYSEQVIIKPEQGVAPIRSPEFARQLEYVITLDGIQTAALLDHGSSASFISELWARDNGFVLEKLDNPMRLMEFSGEGPRLTMKVLVKRVDFVGIRRPWTFIVSPAAPATVVIGLDMIRKWCLCYNPRNDKLFSIRLSDPRIMVNWMSEESVQQAGNVAVDTECLLDRLSNRVEAMSVTGTAEAEREVNQKLMEDMPLNIVTIVKQFPDLFLPPLAMPPTREITHVIRLKDGSLPIKRTAYPLGETKLAAMRSQIEELAQRGWIEPTNSPWAAPILFVRKKEGDWRLVIDYRDLNAVTIDDSYPLPRVELLLHRAGAASVFSKLDLTSGFHQIAMSSDSKILTAFRLPEPVRGCTLWHWTVMPFGLRNAPPTFQRAMTLALQGLEDFATVYVDDILVYSNSMIDHERHLSSVFDRLQQTGYHVRLKKCDFAKSEVEFLGHKLTKLGLQAEPQKVETLNEWTPPLKNPKQVRQFLGLIMWYKAFIPHLATIATPLFTLTSPKRRFEWTDSATEAMMTLKRLVLSAPCLARWEGRLPTRVIVDASKLGIGAVLEQQHNTQWRPVAFWSRKFSDPETRYSTTEREWLAVVDAVTKRWRGFLEDKAFMICSDHSALERKLLKCGAETPANDRQCRWIEALMPFPLTFQYIKGTNNVVADALSRSPLVAATVTIIRSSSSAFPHFLRIAAKFDVHYQAALSELRQGKSSNTEENGLIRLPQGQLLVPNDAHIKTMLLADAHDHVTSGHFGVEKTYAILSDSWYWRDIRRDTEEYVQTCVRCQKAKQRVGKPKGLLSPILSKAPGDVITLDFVSRFVPAKTTRNTHCLIMVDKFSRFVMMEGCSANATAKWTASTFIKRVLPLFGIPRAVISDRGPQFTAVVWKEILLSLGAQPAIAASHHPQSDGQSERHIQTLLRLIRTYASDIQASWEEMLPHFEVALNNVPNASTKETPSVVALGRKLRLPRHVLRDESGELSDSGGSDREGEQVSKYVLQQKQIWESIYQKVQDAQNNAAQRMKRYYDRGRSNLHLQPGDWVLLSTQSHAALEGVRKHRERYVGPYIVVQQIHQNAYKLKGLPPAVPSVQNVQFLKLFRPSPAKFDTRPNPGSACPLQVDGQIEWEVEKILAHRRLKNGIRFCIKWKDTPQKQWLRDYQMVNCREMIHQYFEALGEDSPNWCQDAPAATEQNQQTILNCDS